MTFKPATKDMRDRGYDAGWFRDALIDMGISPCTPSRRGRKEASPHDADLYRRRHNIEKMFVCLKDWRRTSSRYDRCPILFLSACALAATSDLLDMSLEPNNSTGVGRQWRQSFGF